MTAFRNTVENLLIEKDIYLPSPKTLDDKESAWYKAGINPNLVMDYNAFWYGMPVQNKSSGESGIVDKTRRFVIKAIKQNENNSYGIIQEVKKVQDLEDKASRWKYEEIGPKITIPAEELLKIIKLPENKYIYDHIMRKGTTKARIEDPEVAHSRYLDALDKEEKDLNYFYDDNKDTYNLLDKNDAAYAQKLLAKGYSSEFVRKYLHVSKDYSSSYEKELNALLNSKKPLSEPLRASLNTLKDLKQKLNNVVEIKNDDTKLLSKEGIIKKLFGDNINEVSEEEKLVKLRDYYTNVENDLNREITDIVKNLPNIFANTKDKSSEWDLKNKEKIDNLNSKIFTYSQRNKKQPTLWDPKDYESEFKKYGIK